MVEHDFKSRNNGVIWQVKERALVWRAKAKEKVKKQSRKLCAANGTRAFV